MENDYDLLYPHGIVGRNHWILRLRYRRGKCRLAYSFSNLFANMSDDWTHVLQRQWSQDSLEGRKITRGIKGFLRNNLGQRLWGTWRGHSFLAVKVRRQSQRAAYALVASASQVADRVVLSTRTCRCYGYSPEHQQVNAHYHITYHVQVWANHLIWWSLTHLFAIRRSPADVQSGLHQLRRHPQQAAPGNQLSPKAFFNTMTGQDRKCVLVLLIGSNPVPSLMIPQSHIISD